MDVGIYAIQACRYLTGEEPTSLMASEIKTDSKKFAEVDETILWSMAFPSGVSANCTTTYNFNGINQFRAYSEKGQFGLKPAFGYGGIQGTAGNEAVRGENVDQFATEMDQFSQVIKQDGTTKVSGIEGLRDLLVTEAIYESIRTGKRVDVAKV